MLYVSKNYALAGNATASVAIAEMVWAMKAMLCGEVAGTAGNTGAIPAGSRWTPVISSDGVSTAFSDLLGATFDSAKWVWNTPGNAHSWIVLTSPVSLGPLFMLIELAVAGANAAAGLRVVLSDDGDAFSVGGSITDAPTSGTPSLEREFTGVDAIFGAGAGKAHLAISTLGDFLFSATYQDSPAKRRRGLLWSSLGGKDLFDADFSLGAGDSTDPVISNVLPAGGTITKNQAFSFRVTDETGLGQFVLSVSFPNRPAEVIWRNGAFQYGYSASSSRTEVIASRSYDYSITRANGWPGAPTFCVDAVDTSGNEAA